MRHRVTDAQSDDPDPQPAQPLLLLDGDLVAVAVEPQEPEGLPAQDANERAPPRVVHPAAGVVDDLARDGPPGALQISTLGRAMVDHRSNGVA